MVKNLATVKQPNTTCSNPNCKHGEGGQPKTFYACYSCLKKEKWRSYCCCYECYEEYTRLILESRAKGKPVEVIQNRNDLTKNEILEIKKMDDDVVDNYVKTVELKDYFEENPEMSIGEAVEKVNKDIEKNSKKKRGKHGSE